MRRSLFALVTVVLTTLACMGGYDTPRFTEKAPLTEPWSAMALPLDGGTVTFSDGEALNVNHSTDVASLTAAYGAALTAQGWTRGFDGSAGGITSETWEQGDQSLTLSVMEQGGTIVVSLAILAF